MDEKHLIEIVQQFSRNSEPIEGQVKVIRVPDYKTVYVEQVGESGRSIMLNEYQVDGKTYWAGYSSSSGTVFVSKAYRD